MYLVTRKEILPSNTASVTHAAENATSVVKADGFVELSNVAGVHDEDTVISVDICQWWTRDMRAESNLPNDGLQSVGDTEQRLAPEAADDGLLNLQIGLEVHGGRRLVTDNDLRSSDKRTCQCE